MRQQRINISDLQDDWSHFINQIMQGDEVILTKVDKPIAIISPVKNNIPSRKASNKRSDDTDREEIIEQSSTTSEWWIG